MLLGTELRVIMIAVNKNFKNQFHMKLTCRKEVAKRE